MSGGVEQTCSSTGSHSVGQYPGQSWLSFETGRSMQTSVSLHPLESVPPGHKIWVSVHSVTHHKGQREPSFPGVWHSQSSGTQISSLMQSGHTPTGRSSFPHWISSSSHKSGTGHFCTQVLLQSSMQISFKSLKYLPLLHSLTVSGL